MRGTSANTDLGNLVNQPQKRLPANSFISWRQQPLLLAPAYNQCSRTCGVLNNNAVNIGKTIRGPDIRNKDLRVVQRTSYMQ